MMKEFSEVVSKLMTKDQGMSAKITTIVDNHLGKGKKVGDCTEEQAPQIDLILFDLKNLLEWMSTLSILGLIFLLKYDIIII